MGEILASLARHGAVVIEASPGAGKTTRVPRALLAVDGDIVVLEPRRLAARLAAARVAAELGEELGQTVGYQVRYERRLGRHTRIRFVTEGVLTRWMMRDPSLPGVSVVVLDELHERHIHTDLALALLLELRKRRELAIVAMSATLDAGPIVELLQAGHVDCAVERHPVAMEYAEGRDALDVRVASAARRLLRDGVRGHILAFLPGAAEIRRAGERCAALASESGLAVLPLHGALPAAEQDAAVAPSARQKLILATNVAESSITIEGVEAVIDSGLVKRASCSPWSGLPRLDLGTISRASAAQRTGRAGRTGPGRCLRLYTAREHELMSAHEQPEIARSDLSEALLALSLAGVSDARELSWLTPPPPEALARAESLLADLGAIDENGRATPLARRMARLPVHPRLARALVEAEDRGALDEVASAAALLSEPGRGSANLWQEVEQLEATEGRTTLDGDRRRARNAWRARRQLVDLCDRSDHSDDDAATLALLTGFPDRVARPLGSELALADGGRATLEDPSLSREGLVLVLDATERTGKPALVRAAIPIASDALLDAFADRLVAESELVWNEERARVEEVSRIRYKRLVLDESRRAAEPSERASEIVLLAARERKRDTELDSWLTRVAFAAKTHTSLQRFDILDGELARLCQGITSLEELGSIRDALAASLSADERRALSRLAPDKVRLSGGRELSISYPPGGDPYVAGYLQDFFGTSQGPRIGGTALVMHLWGPNKRALQVTRDLASFWDEHYPALRRQLSRRYPKHFWPDDPRHAPAKLFTSAAGRSR